MTLKRLAYFTLVVPDVAQAERMYVGKLGFPVVDRCRDTRAATVNLGDTQLVLVPVVHAGGRPIGTVSMGYEVDGPGEFTRLVADLQADGMRLMEGPTDIGKGRQIVVFAGAAKERIEVIGPRDAA